MCLYDYRLASEQLATTRLLCGSVDHEQMYLLLLDSLCFHKDVNVSLS